MKATPSDIQERAAAVATAKMVATASMVKFTMAIMAFLPKCELPGGQLTSQSQFTESKDVI
jgi:hypothetical protein